MSKATPSSRRAILLTLCFALFMTMLDNTVVNVSLASIQRDIGANDAGLQWIIDSFAIVFASLLLTGGTIGDLYGRKRMFMLGLVVFVAGSALCAAAPSLGVLVVARAIQGVGGAALVPGSLSILTVTFSDPRERAHAIGIWGGVSATALAIGPALGGFLTGRFGWQSVFLINVPVGVAALVLAARVVPESSDRDGRTLDFPGQLLAIVALGSVTYALIEGEQLGWGSPAQLGILAAGAIALAAFFRVEVRSRSPMLPLAFFRIPTFAAANVIAFLVAFGMFGTFFFVALFLQREQGYPPAAAGLRVLATTIPVIFVSPIAGRLAGRFGPGLPLAIGTACCGFGLLGFVVVDAATPYSAFWWKMSILGVGMGLSMPSMTTAVMGSVPPTRSGMASAVTNTSRQLGGAFGIALLGAIVASRGPGRFVTGMHFAFGLSGFLLLCASVLAATFVHRGRHVVPPVEIPSDLVIPAAGD